MSDKKRRISNEIEEYISLADFLAISDLMLDNQPIYRSNWNIIEKEMVTTTVYTNIFGKGIGIKSTINLYIENLGDRVTIYEIEAYFVDEHKNERFAAHKLFINTNCHRKDEFIVLDKGDVVLITIVAILQSHEIGVPIKSLEKLELLFKATGGSKSKRLPL